MTETFSHREFEITLDKEDDHYFCRIHHIEGRPFVVGRGVSREWQTLRFGNKQTAIDEARAIAESATMDTHR